MFLENAKKCQCSWLLVPKKSKMVKFWHLKEYVVYDRFEQLVVHAVEKNHSKNLFFPSKSAAWNSGCYAH